MKSRLLSLLTVAAVLTGAAPANDPPEKTHKLETVSLRKMADSLHAVIAANRQVYARLRDLTGTPTDLPIHAEVLRQANLRIQQEGAEFSYTLRSQQPILPSQGPQTQVEEEGLRRVTEHPEEPFLTEELLGGRSYFTAIYADRATLPSCVDCHNRHAQSPRRDYQLGDVMGAIVVRIPLEF